MSMWGQVGVDLGSMGVDSGSHRCRLRRFGVDSGLGADLPATLSGSLLLSAAILPCGAHARREQGFYMRPGAAISAETPSIFECLKEEHCPGGAPGTCADNRDPAKIACGACKSGSFEFGSSCMPCEGTSAAPVVLAARARVSGGAQLQGGLFLP